MGKRSASLFTFIRILDVVFFCKLSFSFSFSFTPKAVGGLVDNTLAYHTGDPGSIPGRSGSSEKCESIWGDFSSPACN